MSNLSVYREIYLKSSATLNGLNSGAISSISLQITDFLAKSPVVRNVLLYGATGTGKTFTVTTILKLASELENKEIKLELVDASSIVRSGVKGTSLDDLKKRLVGQERSTVLFFDEVDKIVRTETSQSIIGEMLGFVDSWNEKGGIVIFAGAFGSSLNKRASTSTFESLGLSKELIGRISEFIYLERPSLKSIEKILLKEDSEFNKWVNHLKSYSVSVEYTEEDVKSFAEQIHRSTCGLRDLKSKLYSISNNFILKHAEGSESSLTLNFKEEVANYDNI